MCACRCVRQSSLRCCRVAVLSCAARVRAAIAVDVVTHARRGHGNDADAAHVSEPEQMTSASQQQQQQHDAAEQHDKNKACSSSSSSNCSSSSGDDDGSSDDGDVTTTATGDTTTTTATPSVLRWEQPTYVDADTLPVVDDKGRYIVSRVQWPTGPLAYVTPPPRDDKLAPRFGYNIVQVKKYESWWKYNRRHPRLSLAYVNIQLIFLLGIAWLVALLTTEYRRTTDMLRTPAAMVGEHRGRGPATAQTQKIQFTTEEVNTLLERAQNNWLDGTAEANYVGSKDYQMKKIARPRELTFDDVRKR